MVKINVLNRQKLKKLGYDHKQYYCGVYKYQQLTTYIVEYLKKYNIPFIYNEACFVHDLQYKKLKTFRYKMMIDYMFFKNMIKLLNKKRKTNKIVNKFYKRLYYRAIMFYILVLLNTPFYFKKK